MTVKSRIEEPYEMEAKPAYYARSLRQKYALGPLGITERMYLQPGNVSADIGHMPDSSKYQKRMRARMNLSNLPTSVPRGWPDQTNSSMAWRGTDFVHEHQYVHIFSEPEIWEIKNALRVFQGLEDFDVQLRDVNMNTFRLTTLGSRLLEYSNVVHHGRGFVVLRGLNPKEFTDEENTIIFMGISSYFGETRGRQDQAGNMIKHIVDINAPNVPKEQRQSLYTNAAQPFHTDVVCDILALQTLSCASRGGNSNLASSWTVYNDIAATRPDLIHTLASSDWVFDTFGRSPAYHTRPLLFYHQRNLILSFSRRLLTGSPSSPRTPDIPPMTEAQAEALDAVHFTAQKNQLSLTFQPGDLSFINNLSILHSRDSFQDGGQSKRHLVRLWLRNEEKAWGTPKELTVAWDRVFGNEKDMKRVWNAGVNVGREVLISRKNSCGQG